MSAKSKHVRIKKVKFVAREHNVLNQSCWNAKRVRFMCCMIKRESSITENRTLLGVLWRTDVRMTCQTLLIACKLSVFNRVALLGPTNDDFARDKHLLGHVLELRRVDLYIASLCRIYKQLTCKLRCVTVPRTSTQAKAYHIWNGPIFTLAVRWKLSLDSDAGNVQQTISK